MVNTKEKKGVELVKVENYAIAERAEELRLILSENLGGQKLTGSDLERITVPSGGGTHWKIETLDGEKMHKTIEGVVIHFHDRRKMYEKGLDEEGSSGNAPPDCHSDDMLTGRGIPGGECVKCPYAEFGSDRKGVGQKCKTSRDLYIIRPDELLPIIVSAPITSIGPIKKLFLKLAGKSIKYKHVELSLALEETKNQAGIKFSRIVPSVKKRLSPDLIEKIESYSKQVFDSL